MARVTLVVNDAREGSETFLHTLAQVLADEGHHLTVHEQSPGRAVMPVGSAVRGFDTSSRALPPVRDPRYAAEFARVAASEPGLVRSVASRSVRRFGRGARAARALSIAAPLVTTRPDVLHLGFSGIGVAISDALEVLEDRTRLVVSCRGSGELVGPVLDPSLRGRLARVLELADGIHVVAECIGAVVQDIAPAAVPPTLIRPAIRTPRFLGLRPPGPASVPLRLLTVSRLHWVKAVDVQLAAVAQLIERGVPVTLEVIGDGPERDALTFRARALGVSDAVRFVGSADSTAVRSALTRADVFLLSSLSEGTSNAVLEALAAGLAVVSTAAGGMREVLTHEHDALVVPSADAVAMADAIHRLVEEPRLFEHLTSSGPVTIEQAFDVERQRREFAGFYRELLGGPTRAEHR